MSFDQDIQHHVNRGLSSPKEWEIEKIDEEKAFLWFKENFNVAFQLSAVYLLIVFGGQYIMESRPRFDLRKPLLCWSAILAIFSVIGSTRCWVIFRMLYEDNVDTVFIVLRKQKLIFLHWYHHVTVLLFSWHCYEGQRTGGPVFMVMNFVVHSMMYTYYALRAARVKVPRPIALIVTTFQIAQMVLGVATFCCLYMWRNDADCKTESKHLLYGGLMYFSYLVLFCNFFYGAYIKPGRVAAVKDEKKTDASTDSSAKTNGHGLRSEKNSTFGMNLRSRSAGVGSS